MAWRERVRWFNRRPAVYVRACQLFSLSLVLMSSRSRSLQLLPCLFCVNSIPRTINDDQKTLSSLSLKHVSDQDQYDKQ